MPRPRLHGWTWCAALAIAGGLGLAAAAHAADDPGPRHLIYLHGRIVQDQQSARPLHPEFGYYELEAILDAFRKRGFVVSGEMRPKAATLGQSADRLVEQIRRLLDAGVPPGRVTVAGGSMGGWIALLASARLQNPDVRFGVLGGCLSANLRAVREEEGRFPRGRLLSIREASDDLGPPCPPWREGEIPGAPPGAREIVLHTGLSHGFLYRPLPEWVEPVVAWARDGP